MRLTDFILPGAVCSLMFLFGFLAGRRAEKDAAKRRENIRRMALNGNYGKFAAERPVHVVTDDVGMKAVYESMNGTPLCHYSGPPPPAWMLSKFELAQCEGCKQYHWRIRKDA